MKILICFILSAVLSLNVDAKVLTFKSSFYCHSKRGCGKSKGITASGTKVRHGVVAADWKILPRGTKIEILEPKQLAGTYTVEDRGGKRIKGKFLDIWVDSLQKARQLGVKTIKLRILKKG